MRKYAINRYLIFPPHFTGASTLPGEMQKYTNNILFFTQMLSSLI